MCTKTDAFLSQYKHLFPLTIETDGSENSLFFCLPFFLEHMLPFLPKHLTHNTCLRKQLLPETDA